MIQNTYYKRNKKNMNTKLVSFDIFDTLITRTVVKPQTIFRIMQEVLCTDYNYSDINNTLRTNFSYIRINAEPFVSENLRINKNKKEISIDDIYEFLQTNYILSDEQRIKLKELELKIEKNNIVPIMSNIDKLNDFYQKGYSIILISDMYLSSKQIRELLIPFGDIFKNIKIYVSNEQNASKNHGLLYKIVKKEYPNITSWLHIGDNFLLDLVWAKLNDIKTKHVKLPALLPHEKYLLKEIKNNFKIEMIIGCARALRLENSNEKYIYGVSFAAPILYNYVKWVLEQCISSGITNIYFVARDGYILKKIADIIIKESNYKVDTHYFYSSRIATRVITKDTYDKYVECIMIEYNNKPIKKILSAFNITKENLSSIGYDCKISVNELYQELVNNPKLKQLVIEKNKDKADLYEAYLEQELSQNDKKMAFVDSNGTGKTQDLLATTWNSKHECKIYNFYLFNTITVQQQPNSIKCSYYSSCKYISYWIELLCRSPECQTIGYKYDSEKIVPIFSMHENNYIMQWGFNDYLQGIVDYTKTIEELQKKNNILISNIELFIYISKYIIGMCDKKTADIFGSVPFSDAECEDKHSEGAPKITFKNLFVSKHLDYLSINRCNPFIKPLVKCLKYVFSPTTYAYISKSKKLAFLKIGKLKIDISHIIWKKNYDCK